MPSQPRTNLYKSCILSCLVTVALYSATVVGAFAASAASADQSTYAGNMLDKIIEIWAPPPALKSDFRVRIKVSINSHGQVEACKPLKSSGLEAFDSSVCGAVRQIGSFGTPPYGAPTDIHLTFWNGTPKGKTKPETLSSEEAMRAEIKARSKAEAAMGDTRAEATEDRARERAEAVAKASGKDSPEVRPAPIAPPAPQKADDNRKKTATNSQRQAAGVNNDGGRATQLIGSVGQTAEPKTTSPKQAPAASPSRKPADNLPTYGDPAFGGQGDNAESGETQHAAPPQQQAARATETPPAAQVAPKAEAPKPEARTKPAEHAVTPATGEAAADRTKYRRDVARQLRDSVVIPAETEPGEYQTKLRLTISPQGEITDFKVITPTGDKLLDKYVQRGIRRAGSLPPPPAEVGGTLDITLTLVRR